MPSRYTSRQNNATLVRQERFDSALAYCIRRVRIHVEKIGRARACCASGDLASQLSPVRRG